MQNLTPYDDFLPPHFLFIMILWRAPKKIYRCLLVRLMNVYWCANLG